MLKNVLLVTFICALSVGAGCIKKKDVNILVPQAPIVHETISVDLVSIAEEYLNSTVTKPSAQRKTFSAFIPYGQEEKDSKLYYYIWATREEYFMNKSKLEKGRSVSGPVVLILEKENERYKKIVDHKLPEEGKNYARSLNTLIPKEILDKINIKGQEYNKRNELLQKEVKTKAAYYFNYQLPGSLEDIEKEKCIPYSFEKYKIPPDQIQSTGIADWDTTYNSSTVPVYDLRAKIAPGYFGGTVNFAGHFIVVSWSCGKKCQEHAVVDSLTGRIVKTGLRSQYGAEFKLNSLVLVLNPYSAIIEPSQEITTQYYLMEESDRGVPRLNLVCGYNDKVGKINSFTTSSLENVPESRNIHLSTTSSLENSQKRYLSNSKEECTVMLIRCLENEQVFVDDKGCGCEVKSP